MGLAFTFHSPWIMCLFFLFFPFLSFPSVVYFCLWSDIEARGSAQLSRSAPDLSLAQLLLCCGPLNYVTFFLTVFLLRGLGLHSFLPPSSFSQECCQRSIQSEVCFHDEGSPHLPGILLVGLWEKHLQFLAWYLLPKDNISDPTLRTLQLNVNSLQAFPPTPVMVTRVLHFTTEAQRSWWHA